MSRSHRAFALIFLTIFIASATIPIAFNSQPVTTVSLVDAPHAPAATNYVVSVRVFNEQQAFNDDDFEFTVLNGTTPLDGAWVRLFNVSTMEVIDDTHFTDGNGETTFFNLPQGTYQWNVSHEDDPLTADAMGQIVSDGPEADVHILFGNVDWDNDEDDLNATITDIEDDPANNLNFSIHYSANDSIWEQQEVTDGRADFADIPDGNYIWKLSVMDDLFYAGFLLDWGTLEANSTQKLVRSYIGHVTGDADFYDLEVFTYFETSLQPLVGAVVNMTYMNGSAYGVKTTPANGTVIFVDLPIDFMNWSVTYLGLPIGLGYYSWNLSAVSSDIRDPIIASPGPQNFLFDAENATITWTIEDEYPASIEVYIDGVLNSTTTWTESPYDFIFNVSSAFNELIIDEYQVRIVVYDQNLREADDTILLKIYEGEFPVIEGPEDVEFYYSVTGNSISWNVSDDNLNKYTVFDNGEVVISDDIDLDEPVITISLDGLGIAVHNFTLYVNDTSGNSAQDSVQVTVKLDDVVPIIVFTPEAITYDQGATNIIRNWTATDDFMDYYTITVDGEEVINEDWVTENIEFDFAGFEAGSHEVILTVYDMGGNSVESTVTVTVTQPYVMAYLIAMAVGSLAIIAFVMIVWFVRWR
ncbi:MAG: hypothetical protein RTV72_08890 [Candidatus Thorarchaeota archaeon]